MPIKVLRREKAVSDVVEIANFIALDSLEAALRFIDNTEATIHYIASSPSMGSPFRSEKTELKNMRYCRVQGFPKHVIFYIEHPTAVEIVRVLHGARDIEAELPDADR